MPGVDNVKFLGINSKYIFFVFFFFLIFEMFVPTIELPDPSISNFSKFYNYAYKQQNLDTHYLEFTKFLSYLFAIIVGFAIKSHSDGFKNERGNLFKGKDKGYKDILILFGYSIFVFFIAGNSVLAGQYDYDGFCNENGRKIIALHKRDGNIGYAIFKSMRDIKRIYSLKFLQNFLNFYSYSDLYPGDSNKTNGKTNLTTDTCIYPGFIERITLNFSFFFLPFLFGIHLKYIISTLPSLANIEINLWQTKKWNKMTYIILSCVLFFILVNLVFYIYNYARDSVVKFIIFLTVLIILTSIMIFNTLKMINHKKSNSQLMSVSFLLMVLIPFVNIHCVYSLILFGLLNGVLVGEISEKGYGYKALILEEVVIKSTCPSHSYQEINRTSSNKSDSISDRSEPADNVNKVESDSSREIEMKIH